MTTKQDIFIPKGLSEKDVWAWYNNLSLELELIDFTQSERHKMIDYYTEAGLLTSWRKNFFRRHYSHSFTEAAQFLLGANNKTPTIVDLGIGLGSQAILLALMGANVVGIDLDDEALVILEKRRVFYEKLTGKNIQIKTLCQNSFGVDYSVFSPIDGVYSMFAFNLMQPSDELLGILNKHFSETARVAILDGNQDCFLTKLIASRRRKVLSPEQLSLHFKKIGFSIFKHEGKVSLPPPVWNLGVGLLSVIDHMLNQSWFFPVSHQILALRHQEVIY